ncbi:MAG: hypothetical protein A3A80_02615 [Candidatus Terrybacteria bacterium RIFCSPLOWO2_01_FULL_44_24]|uniref:Uncharacterized protein n=1 Tax=Candidatus Terrybacteria bacterium RIFCSPHIGHO2_01_FULL_43_35 TaxID=1802361 RepID=A0A1G2PEH0_9BACT|nr:MAG: hypothetical protein A2828_02410 [Candidatus Terrybacteria bacterium RIFCSPHIGHO2_01_FULL_43_35]OHA50282.1 MAG: hypothetical protein A3B75_00585 [Candidatus Terrybacteria bacterium RIFCSPHIGHO2_02_FULL_43_14]OHA50965.1 MAG: hypothetical protein A3A80_02615 [Candidatus Terrybacteria bacterium RIFCSPLOWO2_01_FULL_44_24]
MKKSQAGVTILEFIVYVGILAIMSGVTVVFLTKVISSYAIIRAEKNLSQDNALAFERIFNETRHAKLIYTPTSVLETDASQLSLRTSLNPPADETFTYVDYYVDNGVLYEKREGNSAIPLTGSNSVVTVFNATRFYFGGAEGIRITLVARTIAASGPLSRTFSWTSSSTLRGY